MRRRLLPLAVLLCATLLPFAAQAGAPVPPAPGGGTDLQGRAETGDPAAQYERGKILMRAGRDGNAAALAESVVWFRKSADQGHVDAAYFAGYAFYSGVGVAQDYALAQRYLLVAAEKGSASAMFTLGHMRLRGEGLARSAPLAAEWYARAAEKGNANAQAGLAILYAEGQGVPRDGAKAVSLGIAAAEQGNITAMYNLGIIYAKGEAVPRHPARAMYWLRYAAANGYFPAAFSLGRHYCNGLGAMKPDPVQASLWLQVALTMDPNSRESLELFTKLSLTRQQTQAVNATLARWEREGIPMPTGPEPQ